MPVFWIPVSMAMAMMSFLSLLHSFEKRQPKANPSHGKAKPTTPIFQSISLIMKNCDQIPHTSMKRMRRKETGRIILTRKSAAFGRHFRMPTPMRRGTTSMTAYVVILK